MAVELADTPVFDKLWAEYPHATLEASGEAVGLRVLQAKRHDDFLLEMSPS